MALLQRQQQFNATANIASRLFIQPEQLNNADLPDGTGPNQLDLRDGVFMNQPDRIIIGDFVLVPGILLAPGAHFTQATIAPITSLIIFQAKQVMQDDFLMTFVCAFDSDAVVNQLDLKLGREFVIPHPVRVLELEEVFKTMFKDEITLFNLFHRQHQQAGGGQAGGGHVPHATSSQQTNHAILEKTQHVFTDVRYGQGYPQAALGARTTADQLQMDVYRSQLKRIISEAGQMTNEIIATLSPAQLDAFILFNIGGSTFNLSHLFSKQLLESFTPSERIFLIGRGYCKLCELFFSIRFSTSISWWFEKNIRDLIAVCSAKLNLKTMVPMIEDKLYDFRTLVIPPTPPATDDDTHHIQCYKNHLQFNIDDPKIRYILLNEPSTEVSSAGGGAVVGDRRKRDSASAPQLKRPSTKYDDWIRSSPLPNARICWTWIEKKAPCTGAFCKSTLKRDHHFPPGVKKADKEEFIAWVAKRP